MTLYTKLKTVFFLIGFVNIFMTASIIYYIYKAEPNMKKAMNIEDCLVENK